MVTLALFSDTHGHHEAMGALPEADIAICAGDISMEGEEAEVADFCSWYGRQAPKHKILIAGNHDWLFYREPAKAVRLCQEHGITYLEDSSCEVKGLSVYGSPWQPAFGGWAFNLPRGLPLVRKWAMIPDATDVLVTHGPPFGVLDASYGKNLGDRALSAALEGGGLPAIRLHVFGHIHDAAGSLGYWVNAAICDEDYSPARKPVVVTL